MIYGIKGLLAWTLTLTGLLMSQMSLAIGTPSISGSISRDTSVDYFDFTIKVTDITQTTTTAKEKDLFKDRIRVWLVDLSTSSSEYVPFEGDNPVVAVPFTLRQRAELSTAVNSNGLTDFTYTVRITANNAGGLKKLLTEKGSGKDVRIGVKYYEDTTEKSSLTSSTISVSSAIVQDAPASVATGKTHKALVVTWAAPTTVTWSDNSQKEPTTITVLVMDKAAADLEVPAYSYDSNAVTDTAAADGTCVFNPNFSEGTSCINCSDSKAYLNVTQLQSLQSNGFFVGTASPATGKVTVPGLTNDKPYAVVAFYGPGGLNRSTCVTGTPAENFTYSEINGESSASLTDPKCFIATAAYGTPLHANLIPLRWFRDQVLSRFDAGRTFIGWYYQNGPVAAEFIKKHPAFAGVARAFLWIPVAVLSVWMTLCANSPWLILIYLGCAAVTVGGLRRVIRGRAS